MRRHKPVLMAIGVICSLACHDREDLRQISNLRAENESLKKQRAIDGERVRTLEASLADLRRRNEPPTRVAVQEILNTSKLVCCRITSLFDAATITTGSDDANK